MKHTNEFTPACPTPLADHVSDYSFDLAGACNLGCSYCFEKDIHSRLGPMAEETARASEERLTLAQDGFSGGNLPTWGSTVEGTPWRYPQGPDGMRQAGGKAGIIS